MPLPIIPADRRSLPHAALAAFALSLLLFGAAAPAEAQSEDLDRLDRALQRLVEKVSPSVVAVRFVGATEPAGEGTAVPGAERRILYQGSGVIRSREGEIVTVMAGGLPERLLRPAERLGIEVELDGGVLHSARWLAADAETGIALLAIEGDPGKLRPVRAAMGTPPRGATVIAIGADGIELGHVVHPARGIQLAGGTFPRGIVTNIAAQPGDVGGLLADANGDLVGLLAFSISPAEERPRAGGETGLAPGGGHRAAPPVAGARGALATAGNPPPGLVPPLLAGSGVRRSGEAGALGRAVAIPVDLLEIIATQLRTDGRMERGALGATFQFHHPALAGRTHYGAGALVREIVPGGAAEVDGLRVGDVIQRVEGREIHRAEDLLWFRERVEYGKIGAALSLDVARMENRRVVSREVRVRIGTRPEGTRGDPIAPPPAPECPPKPAPEAPAGDESGTGAGSGGTRTNEPLHRR